MFVSHISYNGIDVSRETMPPQIDSRNGERPALRSISARSIIVTPDNNSEVWAACRVAVTATGHRVFLYSTPTRSLIGL